MSWLEYAILIVVAVLMMPVFKWLEENPKMSTNEIDEWQRRQARQAAEKARSRRLKLKSLRMKRRKK